MSVVATAQLTLAHWERGLPFDGGLPFESLLRRCRLDYSPASLGRVDLFLDALRSSQRPNEADFLAVAANRQLLYLLSFYAGEVIGRALNSTPLWLLPTQAAVLAPQQLLPAHAFHGALSARFGAARTADGRALFVPLAAVCSRLFGAPADAPGAERPGLAAAADAWWPEALRDPGRAAEALPPRPGQPGPPAAAGNDAGGTSDAAPGAAQPDQPIELAQALALPAATPVLDDMDFETPEALYDRARRELSGANGVPADPAQARAFFQRASTHGHVASMDCLGTMCAKGVGGSVDLPAALDLFKRAGQAGLADAQLHAAQLHLRHDGVAPDLVEAERWLRLAAAQGNEKAQDLIEALEFDQPAHPTVRDRLDGWVDTAVDSTVGWVQRLAAGRGSR